MALNNWSFPVFPRCSLADCSKNPLGSPGGVRIETGHRPGWAVWPGLAGLTMACAAGRNS